MGFRRAIILSDDVCVIFFQETVRSFVLLFRLIGMPAHANPRRGLSSDAAHGAEEMRPLWQRDHENPGKVRCEILINHW